MDVELAQTAEQNRRPQTLCRITPAGRKRFLEYLGVLEQVVRDAAEAAEPPDAGRRRLAPG